jgi:RNA polymerase sigma-70 factor, ECF subfamily
VGHRTTSGEYADRSDADLVKLSVDDLDAFGELVRRHQDFVFGAALRIVRDPVLAQDVAQEAFVRAYKAIGSFRGDAQVRSWLYRIATNLALNAVQRRREYPSDSIEQPARTPSAETAAEHAILGDSLVAAIAALPKKLRKPFVLREFEAYSYQEIADELDLPLNTVRTRILRARRSLRDAMEEWR